MKTFSGHDAPVAPGIGHVSLIDLVVMLGRKRRFGDAGSLEYSVLHHSMLVALFWIRAGYPANEIHYALLHDAHEYVTGDIPGPVKEALRRLMGGNVPAHLDPIKKIEGEIDVRIRQAVGLLGEPEAITKRRIKICDYAALLIEGVMFGAPNCDCSVDIPDEMHDDVYALLEKALPFRFAAAENHGRNSRALLRREQR